MSRSSKGIDILQMLDEGFETFEVAERLGCSESYVRSVRWKFRHQTANPGYSRQRNQQEARMDPVVPDNRERALRMLSAGLSPYEIYQVIPSARELF